MALINCKECGNEISDKASTCPHCGAPINISHETMDDGGSIENAKVINNNIDNSSEKKDVLNKIKKKIDYKKIGIIGGIVVGVLAIIVVACLIIVPIVQNKKDESSFEEAKELISDEKFDEAKLKLEGIKNSDIIDGYSNYYNYNNALISLKNSDFQNAKKTLQSLGDVNFEKTSYYLNACDFMSYEKNYSEGNLKDAKQGYESLPQDFEYNGIKVSDRLAKLNEYDVFVNFTGTWNGSNGQMYVKQYHDSTGIWQDWTSDPYNSSCDIKCIINEDGTIHIKGTAHFWSYTNYSVLSTQLKPKSFSVPIDVTVGKDEGIPGTLAQDYPALVSKSGTAGTANVNYEGNVISLIFNLTDSNYSANFTYTYRSSITYDSH